MKSVKIKKRLIYRKSTYKINGILFDVFKELNYGFREKIYQHAISQELLRNKISFKREVYIPIYYKNHKIGRYFIDFLIDNKIALEIKVADRFYSSHISQLLSYLKSAKIKLGLLAIITPKGIRIKRLANTKRTAAEQLAECAE
ncbi:GxxExxY protein [Patescibacteria group bacterium]|nr:GxxExxY protein [Patescibacteria group bacterium]